MTRLITRALSLSALFTATLPADEPGRPASAIHREWPRLSESGIDLSAGYTSEVWSNLSGGERRGTVATHLFDFSVSFDLEKVLGWKGATIHQTLMAPLGRDLSADYTGNLFTVSNAAATPSLYLYELWFQQTLWEERFSLRLGQLAADAEFATTTYGALFLNAAFGWPPFLSENLPNVGPAFPRGTAGIRLAITPVENFTLQGAIYQGDPFAEEENRHGPRWKLDSEGGYTLLHEAQLRWHQGEETPGLPGEAKLGLWYQSATTPAAWAGSAHTHSGNHGAYLVLEQMLYRKPSGEVREAVGWFGRVATQPQNRNLIGFYFDTGLTWEGPLPGRHDDRLGMAFAYGELTPGARRTLREEGAQKPGAEMVLELTYLCRLTPWLSLQPDVQYVIHPGATKDHHNAWVVGMRANLAF